VRREELMDSAERLAAQSSFEAVSVEQIAQAAGVAKGTFYLYFPSKDELFDAMLNRHADRLMSVVEDELKGVGGTALEQIQHFWLASARYKLEHGTMIYANHLLLTMAEGMRQHLMALWADRIALLLRPIIEQGVADGTLHCSDPATTTDILLAIWFTTSTRLWQRAVSAAPEDFVQTFMAGTQAICEAQELLLGVPAGSFAIPQHDDVVSVLEGYQQLLDKGPDALAQAMGATGGGRDA